MKIPFLILAFFTSFLLKGQDCKQILEGGIYDINRQISNTERAESFVNWYRFKEVKTYEQAKSFGLSIGLPIDGLLASLGLSSNERDYQQFLKEIENYQSTSLLF